MRKFLALLLCFAMLSSIVLVSCSKGDSDNSGNGEEITQDKTNGDSPNNNSGGDQSDNNGGSDINNDNSTANGEIDQNASKGLEFELNAGGLTYSVVGIGTCSDTDIIISSKYDSKPVTSIGESAFEDCDSLTSVTIPNSVTSLGDYAFCGCTSLTNITVEEGNTMYHSSGNCLIKTAEKTLVLGCKNSVIPDDCSVTSIGDCAFGGCTSLTSITIPNSVTSIGEEAFGGCTSLTSVTIGNSVKRIGDEAFVECTSLTSVTIGNSVTSIGDCAFGGCTSLTSVTFENTSGWTCNEKSMDVTNPATNATNLTGNYMDYGWKRS